MLFGEFWMVFGGREQAGATGRPGEQQAGTEVEVDDVDQQDSNGGREQAGATGRPRDQQAGTEVEVDDVDQQASNEDPQCVDKDCGEAGLSKHASCPSKHASWRAPSATGGLVVERAAYAK